MRHHYDEISASAPAAAAFPLGAQSADYPPTGVAWADLLMAAGDSDHFAELIATRDLAMRSPGRAARIAAERHRLMAELRDLAKDPAP
jgi:hypothetical protein